VEFFNAFSCSERLPSLSDSVISPLQGTPPLRKLQKDLKTKKLHWQLAYSFVVTVFLCYLFRTPVAEPFVSINSNTFSFGTGRTGSNDSGIGWSEAKSTFLEVTGLSVLQQAFLQCNVSHSKQAAIFSLHQFNFPAVSSSPSSQRSADSLIDWEGLHWDFFLHLHSHNARSFCLRFDFLTDLTRYMYDLQTVVEVPTCLLVCHLYLPSQSWR